MKMLSIKQFKKRLFKHREKSCIDDTEKQFFEKQTIVSNPPIESYNDPEIIFRKIQGDKLSEFILFFMAKHNPTAIMQLEDVVTPSLYSMEAIDLKIDKLEELGLLLRWPAVIQGNGYTAIGLTDDGTYLSQKLLRYQRRAGFPIWIEMFAHALCDVDKQLRKIVNPEDLVDLLINHRAEFRKEFHSKSEEINT